MTELAFPLMGMVLLFAVAMPGCTLIAKWVLLRIRRRRPESWRGGDWTRYAVLVAPVMVPALWLISAAPHCAEPSDARVGPIVLLAMVVGTTGAVTLRQWAAGRRAIARAARVADPAATARLEQLALTRPALQRARLVLVEGSDMRTVGLWLPVVEIGRTTMSQLDDDALVAALLHEVAHCHACDPLRYVVLSVCQELNPLARLLEPEVASWRLGREEACDREAVHQGGHPLALAEAIVMTARRRLMEPEPKPEPAGLTGRGAASIQDRVALLFEYVRLPPGCTCSRSGFGAIFVAFLALLVMPWWLDGWPLLDLRATVERAMALLLSELPASSRG